MLTISSDWEERDDVVAAGSICPILDCGALAFACKPPELTGQDKAKSWLDFSCPRCGIDFTVREDELLFQSVQREWLLARLHAA